MSENWTDFLTMEELNFKRGEKMLTLKEKIEHIRKCYKGFAKYRYNEEVK